MSAADNQARMQRRNMEIGHMLRAARISRNATISECAALIGTGRPRYRDIESGASLIAAVELEILMEFLQIPQDVIVPPEAGGGDTRKILRLPIIVSPDDTIYLVVDIAQGSRQGFG